MPTTTAPPTALVPYPRATAEELSDEIARVFAHRTGATYRLLVLIRAYDEIDGWGPLGFKSCADWLAWRVGVTAGTAREHVRVARALGELPELSRRMEAGELSYSVARALTRVATPENEEELVEMALGRVAEAALSEGLGGESMTADGYQVVVHVSAETSEGTAAPNGDGPQ